MRKVIDHILKRISGGCLKWHATCLVIGLTLLWLTPSQVHAEEEKQDIDVYEIVFGHIEDAYEWHITDIGSARISIPLPVILHDENGWHCFLSSRLENGATYEGFRIASEGDHKGKIITTNKNGEEVLPVDLSITKNVVALMINSAILVIIMLSCASWYKKRTVCEAVPKGGVGAIEALTVMIYDDVIKSGIGENYKRFAPYLLTVFFFILVNINTLPIMLAIGGPERFGAFTGYYYMATFSAAVVCPTVIGFLIGVSGTYNALQAFGLVTMVLALLCLQRVRHGDVVEGEGAAAEEA